jgi:Helix-turn-helix domain
MSDPLVLLDITEAAEKLGCSERWLLNQLRAGRFRGRKIARRWKLSPSDLDAIIDACAAPVGGRNA